MGTVRFNEKSEEATPSRSQMVMVSGSGVSGDERVQLGKIADLAAVDDSTIEKNGSKELQVKDEGVTPAKLDSDGDFDFSGGTVTVATPSASGHAVPKSYVDQLVEGLLDFKGAYNASTNSPDLDSSPSGIKKGDTYRVSAAGDFFAEAVQVGDMLTATQDDPTTIDHWIVGESNFTDAEIAAAYANEVAIVTQGVAEAGTSTTVYRWTPERVKQAIAALGGGGGAFADGSAESSAEGGGATAQWRGEVAYGKDNSWSNSMRRGDALFGEYTTSATPGTMALERSSSYRMALSAYQTVAFRLIVTAKRHADGDKRATWFLEGEIGRAGGSAVLQGGGTSIAPDYSVGTGSTWRIDVEADTTYQSLRIKVTGEASVNIKWAAVCTFVTIL